MLFKKKGVLTFAAVFTVIAVLLGFHFSSNQFRESSTEPSSPVASEDPVVEDVAPSDRLADQIPEGEIAVNIRGEYIHSLPQDLKAGDRVDLLSIHPTALVRSDVSSFADDYEALLAMQNLLVLAAQTEEEAGITISATIEEAQIISATMSEAKFTFLGRSEDDNGLNRAERISLREALEDLQFIQSSRDERNAEIRRSAADFAATARCFEEAHHFAECLHDGERGLQIPPQVVRSIVPGLVAGDRVNLLAAFGDGHGVGETPWLEESFTVDALQDVLIVNIDDDAGRGLTVAVTAEEAEMLALLQVGAVFDVLGRNRNDAETNLAGRHTFRSALGPPQPFIDSERRGCGTELRQEVEPL